MNKRGSGTSFTIFKKQFFFPERMSYFYLFLGLQVEKIKVKEAQWVKKMG